MRHIARTFLVLTVLALSSAAAHARSQHAAPKVTKCAGGCTVNVPILNHDGYKIVHAWAVPASVAGPNRTNIMQPPSGLPGAQYLGTVTMGGKGNFEINAKINGDAGNFAHGSPIRIFTGYHNNPGENAHVWGASEQPFNMEVGP